MRSCNDRDAQGRPLCPVCGGAIRPIEDVPGPDDRSVHFYCLPAARADGARGNDPQDTTPAG